MISKKIKAQELIRGLQVTLKKFKYKDQWITISRIVITEP